MLEKKVEVIEYMKPKSVISKLESFRNLKSFLNNCNYVITSSSQPNTIKSSDINDFKKESLPKEFLDVGNVIYQIKQ